MVAVLGCTTLIPAASDPPRYIHYVITTLCIIQLSSNFAVASFHHPGRVETMQPSSFIDAPLQYDGWQYCHTCQNVKPPNTHHCSRCGFCVRGMDHHCVYLGQCVGSETMPNFLNFLFWMLLGCTYGLLMVLKAASKEWEGIQDHSISTWSNCALIPGLLCIPSYWVRWLFTAPSRVRVTGVIAMLCFTGISSALIICLQQLRLLGINQTYIKTLKEQSKRGSFSFATLAKKLEDVYGRPNWAIGVLDFRKREIDHGNKRI